ncbi:MAG: hypothetical protein ACWGOX_11800 [Desulforhopalus sp.]
MKEIVRVVKPGGTSVTTFSDRWFPGKEIMIWADLHPFERLGLVMDYYIRVNGFDNINTESVQGLPRPVTDKYFGKTFSSDPIFAVWGRVK